MLCVRTLALLAGNGPHYLGHHLWTNTQTRNRNLGNTSFLILGHEQPATAARSCDAPSQFGLPRRFGGIMVRSIGVFVVWPLLLGFAAAADEKAGIPQLESVDVGWSKVSDDFQPPDSGPGPVTYDRNRPYIPNNNEGRQVTFRIADLTNPILKPWVIENMREQNQLAAAGK